MATTSRTISYDMMDLVVDLLQSVLIARPRVRPIVRWPTTSKKTDHSMRPLLEIVANIADQNHNQSYDQAIVREAHTLALADAIWVLIVSDAQAVVTNKDSRYVLDGGGGTHSKNHMVSRIFIQMHRQTVH